MIVSMSEKKEESESILKEDKEYYSIVLK